MEILLMNRQKNPDLVTIKPDHLGNLIRDGRFLNYQKVSTPSLKDILKWRFKHNEDRTKSKLNPWVAPVVHLEKIDKSVDSIIWFGHASFLIILNGKAILTDPVYGDIPFVKRLAGMPCEISKLAEIDYILLSHAHFDHIDKTTLQQLSNQNPSAIFYCGLNHQSLLSKFEIKNQIVEAGWYQQFPILDDNIEFYFMPALHWSKRSISDRNIRLWGSFVIKTKSHSIYFMGDSGYSPHFAEIGSLFNGFDYCLMGIGAYLPRNIMQGSHTSPNEAVQGFHDLKGKNLIPMHYGTYKLADEPMKQPLEVLQQIMADNSLNGTAVIPKIGEVIQLK